MVIRGLIIDSEEFLFESFRDRSDQVLFESQRTGLGDLNTGCKINRGITG